MNIFDYICKVLKHKKYAFLVFKDAGMIYKGIMHDMDRLSPVHIILSSRYFKYYMDFVDGNYFKNNLLANNNYYTETFDHRIFSPHHWEYWANVQNSNPPNSIPLCYLKEMICDWIACLKESYSSTFNRGVPYYVIKLRIGSKDIVLHKPTATKLLNILKDYKENENMSLKEIFELYTADNID